jgi:hypothetical protein
MKKIINLILLIFLSISVYSAVELNCVDNPTTEVVDYGLGEIGVRMYSGGGTITRFIFSPFNRLNFGGSLDISRLVGSEDPEVRDPFFCFKWRIYDGTKKFPSIAIGYDGQGYDFIDSKYRLPAKGLFLAFSMNILSEGFFWDFGANITKYDEKPKLLGFTSFRLIYQDIFSIGLEYENIGIKDVQQLNGKLGFVLAKVVLIDFIFNNIYSEKSKIDRQIRISYLYKFT